MTNIETRLSNALADLDKKVASMAFADPKPDLLPLFSQIDELAAQLPPGTDPTLVHYLKKKSYQKARLYLQGRDSENTAGNCGHV